MGGVLLHWRFYTIHANRGTRNPRRCRGDRGVRECRDLGDHARWFRVCRATVSGRRTRITLQVPCLPSGFCRVWTSRPSAPELFVSRFPRCGLPQGSLCSLYSVSRRPFPQIPRTGSYPVDGRGPRRPQNPLEVSFAGRSASDGSQTLDSLTVRLPLVFWQPLPAESFVLDPRASSS